jgi:hypothetical protein
MLYLADETIYIKQSKQHIGGHPGLKSAMAFITVAGQRRIYTVRLHDASIFPRCLWRLLLARTDEF